jgi:hypothetical protein
MATRTKTKRALALKASHNKPAKNNKQPSQQNEVSSVKKVKKLKIDKSLHLSFKATKVLTMPDCPYQLFDHFRTLYRAAERTGTLGPGSAVHTAFGTREQPGVLRTMFRNIFKKGTQFISLRMGGVVLDLITTVGGSYTTVLTLTLSNIADYAALTNFIDEARPNLVVGHFHPKLIGANPNASLTYDNGVCVTDYDDNGPLASHEDGNEYDNHKALYLNYPLNLKYMPDDTPDRDWVSTAAPVPFGYFKTYLTGCSISTNYGRWTFDYYIECRCVD